MKEIYDGKKRNYLLRAKKLREQFNQFYLKVLSSSKKGMDLYRVAETNPELLNDFANLCENNDDVIFLVRLATAMMYVQDPTNKDVVQELLADIELNSENYSHGSK